MFSLSAPTGELKNFTAVVPVVNCCAAWGAVMQYWPPMNLHEDVAVYCPICVGTWLLPRIEGVPEIYFGGLCAVLAQSVSTSCGSRASARRRTTP